MHMNTIFKLLPVAVAALVTAQAVSAHHSFAMFDRETQMVKKGTVVRWAFNNPHSWLYLNIKNDDGSETLWGFEGSAQPSLLTRGITGKTFEPGDPVTFMFCPLRDGRPGGAIGWAELKDGTIVNPADGGCPGNEAVQQQWKEWMKQGITSNKDPRAQGQAKPQ
jgi:hypothetical protein